MYLVLLVYMCFKGRLLELDEIGHIQGGTVVHIGFISYWIINYRAHPWGRLIVPFSCVINCL